MPSDLLALEASIDAEEASFSDIVDGAEREIVWADPDGPSRTAVSLVYFHGFSATRQEVDPLCQQVAEALGANLYLTRLTGHGRSEAAMAEASVEDWLSDGLRSLEIGRQLGEKVILIGSSTGGTLATWLSATQPDVSALVLLSPNFAPNAFGTRMLLYPGRRLFTRLMIGKEREWEPANPGQSKYWTWRYPSTALFPMMELVRLLERTDVSTITAPTLMIHSMDDTVVRSDVAAERFEEINAPHSRRVVVEEMESPDAHNLAGWIMAPNDTEARRSDILSFLEPVLAE